MERCLLTIRHYRMVIMAMMTVLITMLPLAPGALADSVLYVRGTAPILGVKDLPIEGIFKGAFGLGIRVPYPASLGLLSGPGAPGLSESIAIGVTNLDSEIRHQLQVDPNGQVTVIGLSQGSIVVSHEIDNLEKEGFDSSNVHFILAGALYNPNGGLAARLPFRVHVPIIDFNEGGPSAVVSSTGPKVTIITNQYDPWADVPKYAGNLFAMANWAMAMFYGTSGHPELSQHNYTNTDLNNPNAIVTTSGNLTSVLMPVAYGDLPITRWMKGKVPQKYIDALDPFLRRMIENGYDRTADPAVRSPLKFLPSIGRMITNLPGNIAAALKTLTLLVKAAMGDILPQRHGNTVVTPSQQNPAIPTPHVTAAVTPPEISVVSQVDVTPTTHQPQRTGAIDLPTVHSTPRPAGASVPTLKPTVAGLGRHQAPSSRVSAPSGRQSTVTHHVAPRHAAVG